MFTDFWVVWAKDRRSIEVVADSIVTDAQIGESFVSKSHPLPDMVDSQEFVVLGGPYRKSDGSRFDNVLDAELWVVKEDNSVVPEALRKRMDMGYELIPTESLS